MLFTVSQIILAVVFISVLLLVEGAYLFYRHNVRTDYQVERRFGRAASKKSVRKYGSPLLRAVETDDAVTAFIKSAYPDGHRLFSATKVAPIGVVGGSFAVMLVMWFSLSTFVLVPALPALAVCAVISFGLPYLTLAIAAGRAEKKFGEQLPDAINLVTRGLQAGHPVPVALEMVGQEMEPPISTEFAGAMERINFGGDRNQALRDIAKRYKNPDFMFFLSAVEMQRESGGNLVDVLDNLVKIIRERANMRRKAMAVSAEGRLTAMIVGALPYALLILLYTSNPEFFTGSADNELFWPLMIGAWFLWLTGIIWIWRMVNIKV